MIHAKEKFLATEPVSRLLLKLSLPAMFGMLVMALYNLVDTIFIGQGVGVLAIAGVAVFFPIQIIVMSVALMIGVGGASLISRQLGSKKILEAEKVLANIFSLTFVSSLLMMILVLLFLNPLLKLFGATETILPLAHDYGFIIMWGTVFFAFTMSANNIIRAEGNAKMAMWTMLIGAILNMILDPIFIFGFKWGIAGAAWSTIISQAVSFLFILYYFSFGQSWLRFHWQNLKLQWLYVREILAVGFSSFVRMVAGSIMAIIVNHSLAIYGGDMAIAVFGIINRLLAFTLMPLFGIIQGMQPIVGFNYGANSPVRVKEAVFLSLKVTSLISLAAFFVLMIFPYWLMRMFTNDSTLVYLGRHALRIIILFLPTIGLQVVVAGMFQAMGRAQASLFLSSLRQVILLIPLVLVLPFFFQLNGVWIAFPVADFLAAIVAWLMYRRELNLLVNSNL